MDYFLQIVYDEKNTAKGGKTMKLRAPAIPLITVDPYFSVWSYDNINEVIPFHWTAKPNTILGVVSIDGIDYRFWGVSEDPALEQVGLTIDALSTTVLFQNDAIRVKAVFTSPLLIEDLYYASRPVSYLSVQYESLDGAQHQVSAKITVSEELVLNEKKQSPVEISSVHIPGGCSIRMGNQNQEPLNRAGDNIRIDWGYFYLSAKWGGSTGYTKLEDMDAICVETPLSPSGLFAFAYDDIHSISYFGDHLNAYWKKDGKDILGAISEALQEYDSLKAKCDDFSARLYQEAVEKGNEQYAELVTLAYRQVMAAHKLVVDTEGNNLYISKECFSNGCAATVDVTYPSAPMYLRYNPELLKAMLRPVLRYAESDAWEYDFAPHDVGKYPILNGQAYFKNARERQMPIEECGNMLILMSAICDAENDASFAQRHLGLLNMWVKYLIEYGEDPGNQFCTDDFAGHLAHNCNLSIKAIMGIAGYSRILSRIGNETEAAQMLQTAQHYAQSFLTRAVNSDGSYRLAYDQEGSFSLKYNAVWDKLWNTNLFPSGFYESEMQCYRKKALPCGVPLDNRESYTKSDWLHWVACMGSNEDFVFLTQGLWNAFHCTDRRVPMIDWYRAENGQFMMFQNRTVQGGLYMRYLFQS